MKKVVLQFPDPDTLTEFMQQYTIASAEVDIKGLTLTADLTEEEIVNACTNYRALLLPFIAEA